MFDHVTIRVSDREASERFYDTVLGTLGAERTYTGEHFAEWGDFSVSGASGANPASRGLHVGFAAPSRAHVDEFWRVGTGSGYRDDGAPGPRPQYRDDYYGAFLLDPDGNSIEAVHHGSLRAGGCIDHLWLRVGDLAASKRFYEAIAPHAGFSVRSDTPGHVQFVGAGCSFSIVPGVAAQHVHIAFPASENAIVDRFHRAATEAGHRDNGPPGERAAYHAGYYAAFVLDPDGNNVEVVSHNR